MPKPTTKKELLSAAEDGFDHLMSLVQSYDTDMRENEFPPGTLNRNIRDVIIHIHHWHLLLLSWYADGEKGLKPEMPAKGYTWRTLPKLNQWIWTEYQDINLALATRRLRKSHKKVIDLIQARTDQELFEKKKYHWTGSTSLGAYIASATSSHYKWGFRLIKKAMK